MGACVSHLKDPKSGIRFKVGNGEKNKKVDGLDHERKIVDSASVGSDLSSKDEMFFDSKPWIDSDCEDDFYSVKGDFTPSRGSTPVHPSSFQMTARLNKTFIEVFPVSPSEPSPRKKFGQLLLETSADDKANNAQIVNEETEKESMHDSPTAKNDPHAKPLIGSPHISDTSEIQSINTTPKCGLPSRRVKNNKTMQGCLPSVHGFVMYEWKKHRASPKHQDAVCA